MSHPLGPIMLYVATIGGLIVLAVREVKKRNQ